MSGFKVLNRDGETVTAEEIYQKINGKKDCDYIKNRKLEFDTDEAGLAYIRGKCGFLIQLSNEDFKVVWNK